MFFRSNKSNSPRVRHQPQPAAPRLTKAQAAREGQAVASFVVNARPGFNIEGKHKFNLVKRLDRIKVEYCRICNQARSLLRIGGADIDYVQETFRHFQAGWDVDTFNQKAVIHEVTEYLINYYNQLFKQKT